MNASMQGSLKDSMEDLLLLVHRMPYPPNKGDKLTSYHLLRHFAARYRLHLATFVDDDNDWQYVETVKQWCAETHFAKLVPNKAKLRSLRGLAQGRALTLAYYDDANMRHWVDDLIVRRNIKRCVVYCSAMAQYVNHHQGLQRVLHYADVDSVKWHQYADAEKGVLHAPMRWLYHREGERLLAFEREAAALSNSTALVTEAEAALFRQLAPEVAHKTIVVENGVNTEYFSPDPALTNPLSNPYAEGGPVLVFTGAMDYWPNVDAVSWVVEDILPRVQQVHPTVRFVIVGARPAPAVQALTNNPAVTVTGTVDDVRPYIAHAALAIVPMRVARGIQNKAIEAMAMGKAIVITPTSAVGVNANPATDFCVSQTESAADVADAVIALLADPERMRQMGLAARAAVVRQYDWERNLGRLDAGFHHPVVAAPHAAPLTARIAAA